jgi:hypothetical protein
MHGPTFIFWANLAPFSLGSGALIMALPTEGYHSMLRVFTSTDHGTSSPGWVCHLDGKPLNSQ